MIIAVNGGTHMKEILFASSKTGAAAPIYLDPNGSGYDSLSLIAEAYCDDIEALTGVRPAIASEEPKSGVYVIAGVIGDELIAAQGVEWHISASGGSFKSSDWERYEIRVVSEGERTKVVIAGSDKRGAVYGIFHITQDIFGVSPWIWWADIKPVKKEELRVSASALETVSKRPSVNFRGFFMNDENPCLNGFADSHFGGLNYMFYDEIFKLILRLKGNYMWPAMWSNNFSWDGMEGVTGKFAELEKKYHYKLGGLMYCDSHPGEDIPYSYPDTNIRNTSNSYIKPGEYPMSLANAVLADRYGITVGASHHEPMARSGGEWGMLQGYWSKNITYRDPAIPTDKGQKVWNYLLNPNNLEAFWSDAIYRNGGFNNLLTIGMRGENDSVLIDNTGRTLTTEENIELLKAVLKTQYRILGEHGVENTPLLLAVYKEVENCWYGGSRNDPEAAKGHGLRDDPEVAGLLGADTNRIVMLCEDNNGYLRTLPELSQKDKFNWGLYYHFDYVGSPKTSMWINTMPLQRSWENLTQAYEYGIDDAWIVNVGDLRPMELPLSYFMDLAYDFEKYGTTNPNNADEYARRWVKEQFAAYPEVSDEDASVMAQLIYDYSWLNGVCKPETLKAEGECSYSLTHYNDAACRLELIDSIIKRADALKSKISRETDCYIPFYQLVYYPAVASANVVRIQIMFGLNKLYAKRGSTLANHYADLIEKYLSYDEELTAEYGVLGKDLNGVAKWHGIMIASPDYCKEYVDPVLGRVTAQAHMNYSSWNGQSAIKIVPERVEPEAEPKLIVDLPESEQGYSCGEAALPAFQSSEKQAYMVNLTNGGAKKVRYTIGVSDDFILIDGGMSGEYEVSHSFAVSIDWSKLSSDRTGSITVSSENESVSIRVDARVVDISSKTEKLHYMSNGIMSVYADGWAACGSSEEVCWTVLEGYGKTQVSVKMLPTYTPSFPAGKGPWLEYNICVPSDAKYTLAVYVGQGNNVSFDDGTHLNIGVQLDGGDITPLNIQGKGYVSGVSWQWFATIEQGGRIAKLPISLSRGEHRLRVWGMDQNAVLQKLVLLAPGVTLEKSLIGPMKTYDSSMGEPYQKKLHRLIQDVG